MRLRWVERVRVPPPGHGQVRVRLVAAGVNPTDPHLITLNQGDTPAAASVFVGSHTGRESGLTMVVGREGAGVVESVGPPPLFSPSSFLSSSSSSPPAPETGDRLQPGDPVVLVVGPSLRESPGGGRGGEMAAARAIAGASSSEQTPPDDDDQDEDEDEGGGGMWVEQGGTFAEYVTVDASLAVKIPVPQEERGAGGEARRGGPPPPPATQEMGVQQQQQQQHQEMELGGVDFFSKAALFPFTGATAYIALVDVLRVRAGESVFIHGGAGGVGSVAVRLARHLGLHVIASTSTPAHLPFLQACGAHEVLDVTQPLHQDTKGKSARYGGGVVSAVRRLTRGYGVDHVLDARSHHSVAEEGHGGEGGGEGGYGNVGDGDQDLTAALRVGGTLCVVSHSGARPKPKKSNGRSHPGEVALASAGWARNVWHRHISVRYVSLEDSLRRPEGRARWRHAVKALLQLFGPHPSGHTSAHPHDERERRAGIAGRQVEVVDMRQAALAMEVVHGGHVQGKLVLAHPRGVA